MITAPRRSAYGRMTTHMVRGLRLKNMTVKFAVDSAGPSPRQVVSLASTAFITHMRHITMLMVYAARSLAPSSHDDGRNHKGSLADSIVYLPEYNANGIVSYTIGVDADRWKSDYDTRFKEAYKKSPFWGTLDNNPNYILWALHEWWTLMAHRIDTHHKYRDEHGGRNLMGSKPPSERAHEKQSSILYPQVAKYINGIEPGEKFLFNGVYSVWQKESKFTSHNSRLHYSSFFPELTRDSLRNRAAQLSGKSMFAVKSSTGKVLRAQDYSYNSANRMIATNPKLSGVSPFIVDDDSFINVLKNVRGAAIPSSWLRTVPATWTGDVGKMTRPTALERYTYNLGKYFRNPIGVGGDAMSRSISADAPQYNDEGDLVGGHELGDEGAAMNAIYDAIDNTEERD
jgi:hypothetical protein